VNIFIAPYTVTSVSLRFAEKQKRRDAAKENRNANEEKRAEDQRQNPEQAKDEEDADKN
jgi:hypothetical protein